MLGPIVTVWRVMTWDVVLVSVLLTASMLSLAISAMDLPYRIQTFGQSSPEEHAFDRRAIWLRVVGYGSFVVATLVVALKTLR